MTRRRRFTGAACAAAAAAAALSATIPAAVHAAQGSSSMVDASASCGYPPCYAFSPASITIHQGDTVSWTNMTGAPHAPAADDGTFNAGTVSSGSHGTTAPITALGSHIYHCQIHYYMTGSVTVVAKPTSAPPPPTSAATHRPTPVPMQTQSTTTASPASSTTAVATPTPSASSSSAIAAVPSLDPPSSPASTSRLDVATAGSSGANTSLVVALVLAGLLAAGGGAAWLVMRLRRSPAG